MHGRKTRDLEIKFYAQRHSCEVCGISDRRNHALAQELSDAD